MTGTVKMIIVYLLILIGIYKIIHKLETVKEIEREKVREVKLISRKLIILTNKVKDLGEKLSYTEKGLNQLENKTGTGFDWLRMRMSAVMDKCYVILVKLANNQEEIADQVAIQGQILEIINNEVRVGNDSGLEE